MNSVDHDNSPATGALEADLLYMWKVKPSQNEGYYRTYYLETPDGDILECDYNHSRNMVQIRLTRENENGRQYAVVIKSGTIIRERDVTSARATDLNSRIYPLRNYFGYLRDEPLLRAIGGNYSIPDEPFTLNLPRIYEPQDFIQRRRGLFERIQDYLRKKRLREEVPQPLYWRLLRRLPAEITDLGVGALLVGAYYYGYLSITELAGYSGFLGILSGAFDWVWRQRSPFLPKVILLLGVSVAAVHHELQYRLWSIFLSS